MISVFRVDTIFIKYCCIIASTYIAEVAIVSGLSNVVGYSLGFLIARSFTAPLFFVAAKSFIFKSDENAPLEARRFLILVLGNILILELFLIFVIIENNCLFVSLYTGIHIFLFSVNYVLQRFGIFSSGGRTE